MGTATLSRMAVSHSLRTLSHVDSISGSSSGKTRQIDVRLPYIVRRPNHSHQHLERRSQQHAPKPSRKSIATQHGPFR